MVGHQRLDPEHNALAEAGVAPEQIYTDEVSGKRQDRPGLTSCQKALREGDTLVVEANDLGISRSTLYRYVGPDGTLREHGARVLGVPPEPADDGVLDHSMLLVC